MPAVAFGVRVALVIALVLVARGVEGQTAIPGLQTTKQFKIERLGESHYRLSGQVEVEKEDMTFFADQVEYHSDTNELVATGSVVYASKENRIAAERLELNTQTRLGKFYEASGTARITESADKSMFGTQEPEAYFYGDLIEKVGPDRYRIRKGGFTTCLQPTPRWEVSASTITLTLNDYAVVKNSLLKVKGVPLFYMPIFYYPVQEDDRATGFLIPVYGTSTIRGQSLSNAFFWAMSRSQDATFMHDWYSQTGQGFGGEYRYVAGPGSDGSLRTYFLKEKEIAYTDSSGSVRVQPSRQSYELRGRLAQQLPANLRARADVDYFSNVSVQQLYQTNLYQASQRQRSYGGNLAGAWGANSVSGTYSVRELFSNEDQSTLTGNAPRLAFQRAPRRLFGSPVYFQFGSEYNKIVRTFRATDTEDDIQGLTRIDFSPQIRMPLSRWPFLAVQTTLAWRQTYYSESLDEDGRRVPEWLGRRFLDMRAELTGPTFTRIFNSRNGFAERIKHVIEPTVTIQRASLIENYDRIVKLESYDYTYGGTTRITYGLTNRFLARRAGASQQTSAREFAAVSLSQTYYSDEQASRVDPSLNSSYTSYLELRKLSPWVLAASVSPGEQVNAGLRMEYDQYEKNVLSLGLSGRYAYKDVISATSGWSRQRRNAEGTLFDNVMNVGANVRLLQGRLGGFFGFDYDFFRDQMLQRRIQGFYNAQCCGVGFEFQNRNLSGFSQYLVPNDRRFNLTFTLAGVGTFSNIFGIFGNPNSTGQR